MSLRATCVRNSLETQTRSDLNACLNSVVWTGFEMLEIVSKEFEIKMFPTRFFVVSLNLGELNSFRTL